MTYLRKDFARPAGVSPGAPAPKEPNVRIVAVEDILQWPARDAAGIRMLGSFVMKQNAKMYTFYQTSLKAKGSYETEGEDDNFRIKQKFETEIPGASLEAKEFVANWMGVDAIVIYGSCADDFRTVTGTKCAPVKLKISGQDDNEARKKMLVFEQSIATTWFPGHYTGDLTLAAPYAAPALALQLNEANGTQYKLIPSAVAATFVTVAGVALPHRTIVTLIGSGGANAAKLTSVSDGALKVSLKDNSDWVALDGSVIYLEVFSQGGGSYTLFEVGRS